MSTQTDGVPVRPPRRPGRGHAHTVDFVASELRHRISSGVLQPGVRLTEQGLTDELNLSRNTLREAFATLAGEGLVERFPNRGVFVAEPGADGVREIYRVRRLLEPAAALWGDLTDEDLRALEDIITRARAAKRAGNVPDMAVANQEFHSRIVGMSGSATVLELMERVLASMRLVFFSMREEPDFHSHYVEGNASILDSLKAGKRQDAAEQLRSYLQRAEAELLEHLEVLAK